MKRLILALAVAALLVPVAAFADDGTSPEPSTVASQMCKQLKTSMGANFASTYGTNANKANAFGKCVSKQSKAAESAVTSSAQSCKAERAKDPAAFAAKYGEKSNKGAAKGAFGKCVSSAVAGAEKAETEHVTSAAAACKAARKASTSDFAMKWGDKPGALGRCVAATTGKK